MFSKIKLLIILLVLCQISFAASIEKAQLLIDNSLHNEAKEELIGIITSDKTESNQKEKAYFLLGKLNYDLGDKKAARKAWGNLIEKYPDSKYTENAQNLITGIHEDNINNIKYSIIKPGFVVSVMGNKISFAQVTLGLYPNTQAIEKYIRWNSNMLRNEITLLLNNTPEQQFLTKSGNNDLENRITALIRSFSGEYTAPNIEGTKIVKIVTQ